jgi:hypothetical protein
VLALATLAEGPTTLCGNCGRIAGKRRLGLGQLVAEAFPPGDRRQQDRRTGDRRDHGDRRQQVDVERLVDGDLRERAGRRTSDAA